MLFSCKKQPNQFISSILNRMVMPFILYQVVDMIYTLSKYILLNFSNISGIEVIKIILKVTFVTGSANSNGPLWFLGTLILTEVVFYTILKMDKKYILYLVVAMMFIIAFFVRDNLLFRIGQIPSSFTLFSIGYFSKNKIFQLESKKTKNIIFLMSLLIFSVLVYINGNTELAVRNFGKIYPLYYIEVFSVTLCILTFSMCIKKNKFIEFLGKNSMVIMCCHYLICRSFIPFIFEKLGYTVLLQNYVIELILAVLVILIMVPVIILINKFIPYLAGSYKYKFIDKIVERKTNG